jgi:branched-chain amino acid transport system ATP-binding protein
MPETERKPVLEIENLGIDFGGLTAVNDLSMTVWPREIDGLIGPNGAGKTTVFNMLTKVYTPSRGTIRLLGQDISGMTPIEVSKAGIARTFQNIRLFSHLSVLDNVKTGMHNHISYTAADAVLRTGRFHREEQMLDEKAMNLLTIFDLDDVAERTAGNLPYGAQRRLEIARAMATEPKLLLLDEPAAGMNPQETEDLMRMIREVRDHFQIAILLIEHDMRLVMGICENITVLNFGMRLAQGTPAEIQNNPDVIKAYLGD